ncbi:MAG: hypothetical protein A2144_01395 [Chloroflexi bacterium RBG_16_50_9]|nr:MAG: hypothetical protein A2144_01395 [Chloroflexi bacterium RBG_16_50_9]
MFYLLAFTVGTIEIFTIPLAYQPAVSTLVLVIGLGAYTLARTFYTFRWHEGELSGRTIAGVDLAVSIFLVFSTGGLSSPFLLYTFIPVAMAGALFKHTTTILVVVFTGLYVIVSHIWNPLLGARFSTEVLERLLFYVPVLLFVAVLPYLTNTGLRQRLESRGTFKERRRLSHEMHDGVAQILSTLRWQAQMVERRLAVMNITLEEVKQLTRLTEKAHANVRECLKNLRDGSDDVIAPSRHKVSPPHPPGVAHADAPLRAKFAKFHPEAIVEAQLLYICREALANIRKHSGAHEIKIKIQSTNEQLNLVIADNGRGFNALTSCHNGVLTDSHGLQVMRERAESIGGKLRVISIPQKGTEIQVEIPLKNRVMSNLL